MTSPSAGEQDAKAAEKAAAKAESRRLAALQTPRESRRRRMIGVLWLVLGLVLITTTWSLLNWSQRQHGSGPEDASKIDTAGIAVTTVCSQHGPFSRLGFGHWWECTANVRWRGGNGHSVITYSNSELTPADIGKPVDVYTDEYTGTRARSDRHFRNVDRPWEPVGWAAFWVGLVVCIGLFGNAVLRLIPFALRLEVDSSLRAKTATRYAAEYRQPGSTGLR